MDLTKIGNFLESHGKGRHDVGKMTWTELAMVITDTAIDAIDKLEGGMHDTATGYGFDDSKKIDLMIGSGGASGSNRSPLDFFPGRVFGGGGGGSCAPGPSMGSNGKPNCQLSPDCGCVSSARDIGYAGDMRGNERPHRTVRLKIDLMELSGFFNVDPVIDRLAKKEILPWEEITHRTLETNFDTMSVIVTAEVRSAWPDAPTVLG